MKAPPSPQLTYEEALALAERGGDHLRWFAQRGDERAMEIMELRMQAVLSGDDDAKTQFATAVSRWVYA